MEDKIYEVTEIKTADTLAMRIRTTVRNTQKIMLDAAMSIGQDLIDAKELIEFGEWENWLENSVGFSSSSAVKYMKIAREYGDISKTELITDLTYTKALKLLALPSEDREEFLENNDVEDLTVKELEDKIKTLTEEKTTYEEDKLNIEKERNEYIRENSKLADQIEALEQKLKELEESPSADNQEEIEKLQKFIGEKGEELNKVTKAKEDADVKIEKLKAQIEQQKKDQEQIVAKEREKAAEEAKEQAKKEVEEEMANLMSIVENASKAKLEAEKKLSASSNTDIMKFKFIVDQLQKDFNQAKDSLSDIEANDSEQGDKLRTALKTILGKLLEQL